MSRTNPDHGRSLVAQLAGLSASEWAVVARTLVLLPVVAILVRVSPRRARRFAAGVGGGDRRREGTDGVEGKRRTADGRTREDEDKIQLPPANCLLPTADCQHHPALSAERIAALVGAVAARQRWARSCLVRALVAERLLRVYGFRDARLVIGVARQARALAAHAWVEHAGRALLPAGGESAPYRPLV